MLKEIGILTQISSVFFMFLNGIIKEEIVEKFLIFSNKEVILSIIFTLIIIWFFVFLYIKEDGKKVKKQKEYSEMIKTFH